MTSASSSSSLKRIIHTSLIVASGLTSALTSTAVATSARATKLKAQSLGILYADDDWAPVGDVDVAMLLARAGVRWAYRPLRCAEFVTPPIFGRHVMLLDETLCGGERALALRHGLGHVLAGHVDEPTFTGEWRDPWSHEERTADVFALLDLVPDRILRAWPEATRKEQLWAEILAYAPTWPSERVADRVQLRLAL